jgi:CTP:molybdopterin cytidylyltransferase MocA
LTAELLGEFTEAFVKGDKPILIPAYQGSLGLPAFFRSSLAEELSALKHNEDLWDVIKRHRDDILDHPTGYSASYGRSTMEDYHSTPRAKLLIPKARRACRDRGGAAG